MKLFSAIGLVIIIVVLKILMSEVFAGFEETLLEFFSFVQAALIKSQSALNTHGF